MEEPRKNPMHTLAVINEGKLKGRRFIIPRYVHTEKSEFLNGSAHFSLACLKHEVFIPDQGCPECDKETK